MPCRDHEADAQTYRRDQDRLDVFAAQLCRAMETLEENNLLRSGRVTSNMRKWFTRHKAADAKAKEERGVEAARRRRKKKALGKLTAQDRIDLGLNS